MTNNLSAIYDLVEQHIRKHLPDYAATRGVNTIDDIYRQYVDIYDLATYPGLVFGYGQVSFSEDRPVNKDFWNIPISLYAVCSGGDSLRVQHLCEEYSFLLYSLFVGEPIDFGIVQPIGMGVSPATMRQNSLVQVGFLDLNISVDFIRKP